MHTCLIYFPHCYDTALLRLTIALQASIFPFAGGAAAPDDASTPLLYGERLAEIHAHKYRV